MNEDDLMSFLGCFRSSGSRTGPSCLFSIFFLGFILHGRLLASALTSHHLHGDGTMVSQTHDLTVWLCRRVCWKGCFGGLMSVVRIGNRLHQMPLELLPCPWERMDQPCSGDDLDQPAGLRCPSNLELGTIFCT